MKNLLIFILSFVSVQLFAQTGRQLFDHKTIGEIKIKVDARNWSDQLDSMRIYGGGLMDATVIIDGKAYQGAGIRFRGDKSYATGLKRNPFQIKLDYKTPGQQHQGYSTVKLSAAVRDPSMIREMLFHEIASKYMPGSKTSFTKLFVNEEYIGIFINIESIDKQMLERNFGSSDGSIFKAGVDNRPNNLPASCKLNIYGSLEYESSTDCYKGNFEGNSGANWEELQELARTLSQGSKEAEKVLDTDRALWMLALNNVMVNLNSYSGNHSVNYYLYKDGNGKFQPIHWDLNLAFGSYKNTGEGSDLELIQLQELDPLLHADNQYKPLIYQLLKDPFYKKVYLAHIRQINEENFVNGFCEKRSVELQDLIKNLLPDDKYKTYSLDDFQASLRTTIGKKSKIPGIMELMSKRSKFLKTHPELTTLPSSVSDLKVQGRAKFVNQPLNTFNISARADRFPKRMLVYYRFNHNHSYSVVSMNEDNTGGLPSGVKGFSASIDAKGPDTEMEYYIVAENAGSVNFLPAAYTREPYKVKLSDLNK